MLKSLTIIIIFLLFFTGCLDSVNNIDDLNDELIIGINQDVFGFHPNIETLDVSTISVNKNIFNSLVSVDEIYRIVPELSISWNNPNNLTWRFFLRGGVKFHNGDNFTSNDVKFTIEKLKFDNSSVFSELLVNIDEVNVVDNLTVDILTKKPCPTLLNKLIDIMIISDQYQDFDMNKIPVGTGPYKFHEYINGSHIFLERFEDYWGDKPKINKVKFFIIEESIDRLNALINGSIDIAETIYPEYYDRLSSTYGLKSVYVDTPVIYYISFDFRSNSSNWINDVNPFSILDVRKAVYHSIDIDAIIDNHLFGFGTPVTQFVSPLIFGYNPEIERLSYDINIAKDLMKNSGYESGFNVSLDCPDDVLMKNISLDIANQLSKINISVDLNILHVYDWMIKINDKNTSFFIMGWIPSGIDGGEIYDYMLRSVDIDSNIGSFNAGYYSNDEVDNIGDQITSTMDSNIRQKLIQKGFDIAMEDVACVPLFSIQWIYGFKDNIYFIPRPDLNIRVENINFIQ